MVPLGQIFAAYLAFFQTHNQFMYWNQSAADLLYTGLLLVLQDKSVRSTNGPRFVGVLNRGKGEGIQLVACCFEKSMMLTWKEIGHRYNRGAVVRSGIILVAGETKKDGPGSYLSGFNIKPPRKFRANPNVLRVHNSIKRSTHIDTKMVHHDSSGCCWNIYRCSYKLERQTWSTVLLLQ